MPRSFRVKNKAGTFVIGPHFPAEIPRSLLSLPPGLFAWGADGTFTYDETRVTEAQALALQAAVAAHDPITAAEAASVFAPVPAGSLATLQSALTAVAADATVPASVRAAFAAIRTMMGA